MYCPGCGAENPGETTVCRECGVVLTAVCGRCAAPLPAGARFCPGCGRAVESERPLEVETHISVAPSGERRLVTVLFADFAGFTSFAEKRDPEDVQDYLTGVWDRLDRIIAEHGGITEKHIGDALMAVFGSYRGREDDPIQGVRAGLALQQCVQGLPPPGRSSPLQLRIGVHTGWVVLSPPGSKGERFVTGDTVNLASRLENSAPIGGVLISHDTYRQVYGLFDVQSLPPVALRGRTEPVRTYLVLRARPRSLARTLRGIEGVATRLIGREQEFEQLCSACRKSLEQRQLSVLTVIGEAGLGKSRLLQELQKWLEILPQQVRFFYGRAMPEWTGLPFALIRDLFAGRFEIQETDSAAVARDKFERGFADLLVEAGQGRERADSALASAPLIGQLLGFDFAGRAPVRQALTDPDQMRQRAFGGLAQFFRVVAQGGRSPGGAVLLALEDVHWADESSLDLLEYLAQNCVGTPLMILLLARPMLLEMRPNRSPALAAGSQLRLAPLSARDSDLLVQSILGNVTEIPSALRDLVLSGAAGNPFYIEEIIKMLIDSEVIVPGPGQWRFAPQRLTEGSIPATLTGVLQARLDRLEPIQRAVLQRASVVGQVFWDGALSWLERRGELSGQIESTDKEQVRDKDPKLAAHLQEALEGLRGKELIIRRESSAFAGNIEYTFKHELLRNVTYANLLKKARRGYHAAAAAWLIESSGERIAEFTAPVAAHFELAERWVEAADWYGRAGQQARAGYAPATASAHFRKALDLLPVEAAGAESMHSKRIEWYEGLSDSLAAQARFAEALENYRAMRALAELARDAAAQARAWNGLAFLHERCGDNRASAQAARQAEALARAAGPGSRSELIRALQLQGWALYRLGDAPAVLALGEQTLQLCQQLGERRSEAVSLKLHGVAHLQLAHFDEAEDYFRQGLALCEELGDRRNAAAMWSNLGETARLRGDYAAALELYQRALSVAREIGHRESEMIYLSNVSGARLGLGQFQQAEADLRQAIALVPATQSCTLSETYSFLSGACLGQDKLAEALEAASKALDLAHQTENHLDLGGAWRVLGQALAAGARRRARPGEESLADQPAPYSPAECFEASLRVFRQIKAEAEQARTLQVWAEFERQSGHARESRNRARAARAILARLRKPKV
jgi:class 3 adenylate cyclase/predicted ATPase/ribosomal protein L40E